MNRPTLFGGAFGGLFGLALLKFGNPIILDRLIDPPRDIWEFLFQPWPVRWGYLLLVTCGLLAIGVVRVRTAMPRWVLALPCAWLAWQWIAAGWTVDPRLTRATLWHFTACGFCFLLGAFALPRLKKPGVFWGGVLAGFLGVLWIGFEQHYGSLEATRKMFYEQPNWREFPAEYIKKIASNRIFSTLVYPNALAAAIILLLPGVLLHTWRLAGRLTVPSRVVVVGVLGYVAAACLFWSGSKSGWLVALCLIMVVLLRQPFPRRLKGIAVTLALCAGLAAFFVKYAPYFKRGAPSVSARFEYWRAALATALEHPVLGTGPGTFSVAFRKRKPPEAEMAQLVHNDYLEQAADSGWIGALTYAGFVWGSIVLLPRRRPVFERADLFVVWLGLLGWSMHSFVEFPLYIPALSWTTFALFGWLWGIETSPEPAKRSGLQSEIDTNARSCQDRGRR